LVLGLHIGWAIEGALGSRFKIDATYLSPNVNMASRVGSATHQFGCPFLMSGEVVQHLSLRVKNLCRLVDLVKVKGSEMPMEIWTFDIFDYMGPRDGILEMSGGMDEPAKPAADLDVKLALLQASMSPRFKDEHHQGIQAYLAGNWATARMHLEAALEEMPGDGPTEAILAVLAKSDFRAPADWAGCRKLLDK
jgi:hypothetical protein